jgi:membrane protease subunit (stomatin/prohibitin family)
VPQVIQWKNPQVDDIVWKYPDEDITWGAQLIVLEMETAVFFRDGKAYDVFGPGRHTLTTRNLPLLTSLLTRLVGFRETPFKATVFFISMKQFAGKYGVRAQTTDLAPLMVHGTFWMRVENSQLFVNEVVGSRGIYSTPDVNSFIRGYINEKIIDELSRYDLLTVFTKLDETSISTKTSILDYFRRLGLELIDLKFEGVDTTPQYRERLFWIKSGRAPPSEVLRMETVKETAKELAKSPGAGLGSGMMIIPPIFGQAGAPAAGAPSMALVVCPDCKAQIPATSKFCPNCGTNLITTAAKPAQAPTTTCPKCGEQASAAASFCPNCGEKL